MKCGFFNGSAPESSNHALQKDLSKIHISSFVPPSKIFIWGSITTKASILAFQCAKINQWPVKLPFYAF